MREIVAASFAASLTLVGLSLIPASASAHVGVKSGPATADQTQEIDFGVGHGCAGSDTYKVRIEIPAGMTSVRAASSSFGKAEVFKDDAENVVAVEWTKRVEDVLPADTHYYTLTIRAKVPNQPFGVLYFPIYQTCSKPGGELLPVVPWVGTPEAPAAEPAADLLILPAKKPGWNKWTVPAAIADLSTVFDDAQIVWKGAQAFSTNAATVAQVEATAGVTPLTALAAGDEIWVKY